MRPWSEAGPTWKQTERRFTKARLISFRPRGEQGFVQSAGTNPELTQSSWDKGRFRQAAEMQVSRFATVKPESPTFLEASRLVGTNPSP